MRRRGIRFVLATLALTAIGASTALGFWTAGGTAPVGRGVAATVGDGATPSASKSGGNVLVSWASSTLSNGVAVDDYLVKRYGAVSGTLATIGAGCAVTITGLSCTELSAPVGGWKYTVTPVYTTNWRGAESAQSSTVTIGPPPISLGSATTFAVLAGSTATSAGVSTLNGNLGVSPGTAATGFPPGNLNGTFHSNNGVAVQAQADLLTAYNEAVARTPVTPMAGDLGGLTLTPGTYQFGASIPLATGLTLDAQGDPGAVFVFQAGSTLLTAAGSHVDLINGASACNVFWQVGSSATLGASSSLAGTIMAATSISMGDSVTVNGRALAHNGAVTMINDTVTVPPACSGDTSAPTGGSISYTAGYTTAATVSITFTPGTDTGSGLASGSGLLQRASATLSGGSCATFGAFATVVTNPTSPTSSALTSGNCYQYRYLISDVAGNQATYTNPGVIIKADSVAPTSVFSITSPVAAYFDSGGQTLYYKGDAAGSFTLVDTVSDAASGPVSATFPAIATTGWVHNAETVSTPAGGPFTSTSFSWSANPANPAAKAITVTDAAGNVASPSISFVSDTTAPVGGAISYTNGVINTLSVPIDTTAATDAGAGIATTTIKRDVAALTTLTETCATFPGTFATAVTLVGGADTSVTAGNCYRYTYVVTDRVGNEATFTSANVVRVDTSGPQVTAIASQQSSGSAGNGRLENGDKLILTFNQNLAGVPATFSGATESALGSGLNVGLQIPGITNGTLDTGDAGYVSLLATATFGGTVALSNNGTSTTVTLTVTSLSVTVLGSTIAQDGALAFQPATTITDSAGHAAIGTFTTAGTFKLF